MMGHLGFAVVRDLQQIPPSGRTDNGDGMAAVRRSSAANHVVRRFGYPTFAQQTRKDGASSVTFAVDGRGPAFRRMKNPILDSVEDGVDEERILQLSDGRARDSSHSR